ncbi:MAG: DUF3891 family protein [Xanthobacteraceae bacterium]|nr:DUF3891 family protein [Xanthobacteraceae bacterium]
MIVREEPDRSLLLINQTDHAAISGLFAAHWGNNEFARPRPYESVVRAAVFHDAGWYRYQTSPRYDVAAGKTPSFTQVPLDRAQLDAFQWAIDWLTGIDPYAGLLINKHRTGLWRGRYRAITHPPLPIAPQLGPAVESFIAENEAQQRAQEQTLDATELWVNYQLLQVWDLLSLYFCVRPPYQQHVEPVPSGYRTGEGVRLDLSPLEDGRVSIDPYPFDLPALPISIPYRHLPTAKFADETAFRAAYFQALPQLMRFELVPAH